MKVLKKIILTIILVTLLAIPNLKASERVGTIIEVTEDAINLFINEQYNRAGFRNNITGNVNGISYNITLYLPSIKLLDNQAKILFGFKIESSIFNGFIEFEDNLLFSVPSIEELSVKGISQAFKDKVNSLNLNSTLKGIIISAWESLQLEVYPMKLAQKVENSTWLIERAISIVSPYFSVDFNIAQGKLKIGLNTYLEGNEYFRAGLFVSNHNWVVKVAAGCQVEVKEVNVYDALGRRLVSGTDFGSCPKKGEISIPFYENPHFQVHIIEVLFKTSNTFYVRSFKGLPDGYMGSYRVLN